MAKKVIVAGEQVPAAQLIIQAHEAAKQEHREAEMKLDAHKERVTTMNKLHRELSNEKEMIANELGNANRMHEDVGASSSSSSSSVLSSSVGFKRERASSSSSSPSSSSSSSSRTAKRQKKRGYANGRTRGSMVVRRRNGVLGWFEL